MKLGFLKDALFKAKETKESLEAKASETFFFKEVKEAKEDFDNIYQDNKHIFLPYINFGKACIMDATCLPTKDEVRIIDYVDLGLKIKENYNEYLSGGKFTNFFPKEVWQSYFSLNFAKEIHSLIVSNYKSNCKLLATDSEGGNTYYTAEFKQEKTPIRFAFVENGKESGLISFFLEKNNIDESLDLIKKIFFEKFTSNKIIISVKNKKVVLEEDRLNKDFIMFNKCQMYIEDINKFLSKNHNRSILFYGPPGSGKSNIIAGIISTNSLSTLKFTNINLIDSNTLIEIIKVLRPDCIVLEDLDHAKNNELNILLEKLEQFTSNVKLILGSANQASNLDNALVRPGRFDKAIEINRLDDEVIMNLVHNDKELFELTKNFPVAYIKELMKRVDVLGKKEALDTMDDIIIRVNNLSSANYSLVKIQQSSSNVSQLNNSYEDEDEYGPYESDPYEEEEVDE